MFIEKAPAKINLALDIIGKYEDNYHNLSMVMTTVDLYDRIIIQKINEDKIILESNRYYLPNDRRNLVYKAAQIMKEKYNYDKGLKIYIDKKIPIAAGLAGGSSNAAATIRAINKLFKLELSLDEMINVGKEIGSDVPFCLYNKTALVEGKGEIIKPLPIPPKCWIILVKPHFGVSTKEIFAKVKLNSLEHPNVNEVVKAINNKDYYNLCKSIGNALEEVTFSKYKEVKIIKEKLLYLGVDAALMSGSGPTVFGLVLKERKAKKIINSLDKNQYETHAVRILG
jgi:4-diphosphocytidyl-2-C-methyl-D-erythritol kinase